MNISICATPLGAMCLECDGGAVRSLDFTEEPLCPPTDALSCRVWDALGEYFAGTRTSFDLPLAPQGSAFQKKVWNCLCEIPWGKTRSYSEIAVELGCKSPQAVGGAVSANPILILIPCHRVIARNDIGGFRAGVEKKRVLLAWEGKIVP